MVKTKRWTIGAPRRNLAGHFRNLLISHALSHVRAAFWIRPFYFLLILNALSLSIPGAASCALEIRWKFATLLHWNSQEKVGPTFVFLCFLRRFRVALLRSFCWFIHYARLETPSADFHGAIRLGNDPLTYLSEIVIIMKSCVTNVLFLRFLSHFAPYICCAMPSLITTYFYHFHHTYKSLSVTYALLEILFRFIVSCLISYSTKTQGNIIRPLRYAQICRHLWLKKTSFKEARWKFCDHLHKFILCASEMVQLCQGLCWEGRWSFSKTYFRGNVVSSFSLFLYSLSNRRFAI